MTLSKPEAVGADGKVVIRTKGQGLCNHQLGTGDCSSRTSLSLMSNSQESWLVLTDTA